MMQFKKRRRGATPRLWGALKFSGLVAKAKRPDAIAVVHREEKIDGIELGQSRFGSRAFRRLAALRVVAQDDASAPTVRCSVGNRGVKHRAFRGLAMKLRAGDQREVRLQREAVRGSQPRFVVNKCSTLPRSVLIVVQGANATALVADVNLKSAGCGASNTVVGIIVGGSVSPRGASARTAELSGAWSFGAGMAARHEIVMCPKPLAGVFWLCAWLMGLHPAERLDRGVPALLTSGEFSLPTAGAETDFQRVAIAPIATFQKAYAND